MAQVDLNLHDRSLTAAISKPIMQAAFDFVGARVYQKPDSELKLEDVTVFAHKPPTGLPTIGAYGVEIIVRLCTEDQPKTKKGKVSKKGHEKMAKQLVRDMTRHIPDGMRFFVWINSGTITGFAEGVGGITPK